MSETPRPDAGSDDSNETPQPQIVVDDPEDFAKTRQLRAIFDARDDYIQARREANEAHDRNGGLSFKDMNAHIFRHLQDFAMSAEPLLLGFDDGKQLWEDKEYRIDAAVCERAALASVQDGLNLLHKMAEKVIDGHVTHQNLRFLADSFDIKLPQNERNRVIEIIEQAREQQTSSTPQIRAQSLDDISNIDVNRLQKAVTQSQEAQTQTAAANASDVVRAIQRVKKGDDYSGYSYNSMRMDQFEHTLRVQATDWGWQTTGIKSLVSHVPKLAYPNTSRKEFGKTAPPQSLSNDVFRDIQLFLDDIGLGISFDETQQTKIDDDLLDEVEDWRSMNT